MNSQVSGLPESGTPESPMAKKDSLRKKKEFYPEILSCLANGDVLSKTDIFDHLKRVFSVTAEQLAIPKKDGTCLYENRMAWALHDLKQVGFICIVKRASYQITDKGRNAAKMPPNDLYREVEGMLADDRVKRH